MPAEYIQTIPRNPFPNPQTEREELLSILWGLKVLVPATWLLEVSELRDIVQWQIEKVREAPEFSKGHMTEEAKAAYREYNSWRNKRNQ